MRDELKHGVVLDNDEGRLKFQRGDDGTLRISIAIWEEREPPYMPRQIHFFPSEECAALIEELIGERQASEAATT